MTDILVAKDAIRELYARYTDAVFRKDADAASDLFTEKAEWRIGGLVMNGRANIVEALKRVFPNYDRIVLNFREPIIDVQGDTANVRVYVNELSRFADGRPYGPIGIYFDRCAREGERWRFAWRLFQTHYAGPPDMTVAFFENPDFGAPPAMPPLDAMAIDHTGTLKRQKVDAE